MSDIHALSGAYAVDALDDLERARFERHLEDCVTCRDEVDSLREAASLMAITEQQGPPASLRDSVLQGIASVRPLPPATTPPVAPADAARPRRRRVAALVAAAAALIAVGGVGATVWHPWTDDATSQSPQLSASERILAADDAEQITQEFPGGGTATIVRSHSLNGAVMLADGLAEAPHGHFYEVWFDHDGVMVPAGRVDGDVLVLSGDAATANAAALSIEPEGTQPTEPTIVYGDLFTFAT